MSITATTRVGYDRGKSAQLAAQTEAVTVTVRMVQSDRVGRKPELVAVPVDVGSDDDPDAVRVAETPEPELELEPEPEPELEPELDVDPPDVADPLPGVSVNVVVGMTVMNYGRSAEVYHGEALRSGGIPFRTVRWS